MISLTTAVGAACASYYFLNRLNAMQEEMNAMKQALSVMCNKVDGIDRRFASSTKSLKRISEDLAGVKDDLSTLELPEAPVKRTLSIRHGSTPRGGTRSRSRRETSDEEEAESIVDVM